MAAASGCRVLAIGGALEHEGVWQRLVAEAGGPGSRIAVFPTASDDPLEAGERNAAALRRAGAVAEILPVAPRLVGVDWQAARDDPALIARVASAQGLFFTGGAQELIIDSLRPGGVESAMLAAIRQLAARGGLIAGTSAGAAVMSDWMFRDAQDPLAVLRGRLREGQELDRGFGFVGPGLFIDQHFLRRGRIGRLLPAMVSKACVMGLGVDEDSAALIHAGRIEILGAHGALLVDLSAAQAAQAGRQDGAFWLRGARLSLLAPGDCHDLGQGESTPAPPRQARRIDPRAADFRPRRARAGFYPDMLGDQAIARAMRELLDSPDAELRGLAFDGRDLLAAPDPEHAEPELGFEFRLYKGDDTLAYRREDPEAEDCTVLRVRLDVSPVRLPRPLYARLG